MFLNFFFFPFEKWMMSLSYVQSRIDLDSLDIAGWRIFSVIILICFGPLVAFSAVSLVKNKNMNAKLYALAFQAAVVTTLILLVFAITRTAEGKETTSIETAPKGPSSTLVLEGSFPTEKYTKSRNVCWFFASLLVYLSLAGLINTTILESSISPPNLLASHPLPWHIFLLTLLCLSKSQRAFTSIDQTFQSLGLAPLGPSPSAASHIAPDTSTTTSVSQTAAFFSAPVSPTFWSDLNDGSDGIQIMMRVFLIQLFLRYFPSLFPRLLLAFHSRSSRFFDIGLHSAKPEKTKSPCLRLTADYQFYSLVFIAHLAVSVVWKFFSSGPLSEVLRILKGFFTIAVKALAFLRWIGLLIVTASGSGRGAALEIVRTGYAEHFFDVFVVGLTMGGIGLGVVFQWVMERV